MLLQIDAEKMQRTINSYVGDGTPGISLLVGAKGKIVYNEGFGMANIKEKRPVDSNTRFIIASVTKQFTTTAIMILKERGSLHYDESIGNFFPDFPDYKDQVTVRHLMTHTSGIKEYMGDDFFNKEENIENGLNQDAILNRIKGFEVLEFEPGTAYSYCNSAYVMLGAIVEKVSKQPFAQFLHENIFKPLGMERTLVAVSPDQKLDKLAAGYKKDSEDIFIQTPLDMATIGWADGNMVSTVEDLFLWHNSLYTEKILQKKTLKEAFTPYTLKNGQQTKYGFGWFIDDREGRKEIWHSGGTLGYISRFSRFPEEDIAIIMLTNYMGIERDKVFDEIVEVVFSK